MKTPPRVLFICKARQLVYGEPGNYSVNTASGLRISVGLSVAMLRQMGVEVDAIDVIDNNDIDRAVKAYQPTHVIIEALWVVPKKFQVLAMLHPKVKWLVRLHSELPFLAQEGMSIDWIGRYIASGQVTVACNSERLYGELGALFGFQRLICLPNYYPLKAERPKKNWHNDGHIDVGCFGANRTLKNHLTQAVAAIEFARALGKTLYYHINVGRVDTACSPVVRNIESLFEQTPDAHLIKHQWSTHHEFKKMLEYIDIGLQVSFTETFNIVAADLVDADVPIVVSPEISWASSLYYADPTSVQDITKVMLRTWKYRKLNAHNLNRRGLHNYNAASVRKWSSYLLGHGPEHLRSLGQD